MIAWWLLYLAKDPRLTSIMTQEMTHNSGCILAVYIGSGIPLMVPCWVPYRPNGCRPDFINCLGGDSNSGPVLVPDVYLSPTRIMSPPRASPILYQMKYTSVQVSYLQFPGGYYTWPRAPHLTSIMAQEMASIVTKVNKLVSALVR